MRKHGEIYTKKIRVGSGAIHLKRIRFCTVHGEIDLFTCADWQAKHASCASLLEQPAAIGLEVPKAMKKAA